MSHVTCERVMSHISLSHVTNELYPIAMHVNRTRFKKQNPMHESCDMWASHVTHITESCHKWIVSYSNARKPHLIRKKIILLMSHMENERVMPHISLSHVTYELYPIAIHVNRTWLKLEKNPMNESCDMRMRHVHESCRTHQWVMLHMSCIQ